VAGRGGRAPLARFRSGTSRTSHQDAVFPFAFHRLALSSVRCHASMCCSRSTPPSISISTTRAELNDQQFAAVTALPGRRWSSRSRVGQDPDAQYCVAYLLEQGIPPERVLLSRITNKRAHEMMRRVADLLGQENGVALGGTFHSIGNRILRQHAALLGTSAISRFWTARIR